MNSVYYPLNEWKVGGFLKKSLPKILSEILLALGGVVAGFLIANALFSAAGFSIFSKAQESPPPPSVSTNADLTALAYSVLGYIKDGDYASLANAAHPEFGVVFSPSATVTLSTNRYFQPDQIAQFATDTNVYIWGVMRGSGEPIEMTPKDYIAKFVFDKDYTAASLIGVNRVVRSGNALENITDVFPDVQFVDFHLTGGDKDSAEDLNWSSLRLGFEEYEGKLWLSVIIHSEWSD